MLIDSLAITVCWVAILWQIPRIDFSSWRARYSFITFLCITLVATFRNPALAFTIDKFANLRDLGRMLEYLFTTGTGTAWAMVCLSLAPPDVQRRRWLLGLAPLALVAMLLLWRQEIASRQPIQEYLYRTSDYSLGITLTAQAYLLAILVGIGMPTLIYRFQTETRNYALRLRLGMLASTQMFAAVMVGSVIALYSLVLYDVLPRTYQSPVITLLMALTALAYGASLVPVKLYTRLALVVDYCRQLQQIRQIRHLERQTAHLLDLSPIPVSLYESLRIPDYVVYSLVTAIVDRHKPLRASEKPATRAMAGVLDKISTGAPDYLDVVKRFQEVAYMPMDAHESPPAETYGEESASAWHKQLHSISNILSYILHPAVLMILTVILISGRSRNSLALTLIDTAILITGLLPGLLYIYVKTKTGNFSHYHLLLKEERRSVLPLLFVGMVSSFVLYALTQAPTIMMRGMLIGLLAGVGAIVISRFWKISLHSAVAMGCAALFIPISWVIMLVIAGLGVVVGISRLVVRHHTSAQVIGGWLYGFGVTSLLVWLLIIKPMVKQ